MFIFLTAPPIAIPLWVLATGFFLLRGRPLEALATFVILSLALRFPVGSLARFFWVLTLRLRTRDDFARGKMTEGQYRAARSLHSVPVMLLSLIPGLGAIAYFASGTMMRGGFARMMVDQFAYKLPVGVYCRLRLARVTAPRRLYSVAVRRRMC